MKYASPYYGTLHKFSHANTNMNRLCKDIERWCKTERYSSGARDFDYRIMIDETIEVPDELQTQVNALFVRFQREMAELAKDQAEVRKYGDDNLSPYDSRNFSINWGYYYDIYEQEAKTYTDDIKQLANAAVRTCYEYYSNKANTRFMWVIAGEGILENIQQQKFDLPIKDENGEFEYLGNRYNFAEIQLEQGETDDQ